MIMGGYRGIFLFETGVHLREIITGIFILSVMFLTIPLQITCAEDNSGTIVPIRKLHVNGYRFQGNTVFSDEQLAKLVANYTGRWVSVEELFEIKHKLMHHYVSAGYINSGVVLPDQEVEDGIVTFQIVEGTVSKMILTGVEYLRPSYVKKRLELITGTDLRKKPLNIHALQQQLRLIKQDANIDNILAKLESGEKPGQAVLNFQVTEADPLIVTLGVDNHQPPGIGGYRANVGFRFQDVTGWGDAIECEGGLTEGKSDYSIQYTVPVTRWDTRLDMTMRRQNSVIIDEPFSNYFDIASDTTTYSVALSHPIYRTVEENLTLGAQMDRHKIETSIDDIPYSFTPAENDKEGEYTVSALRFSQQWLDRNETSVIAIRSTLSFGLDMLDATVDIESPYAEDCPDGSFTKWVGQALWAKRFETLDSMLLMKADLQLSDNTLLPVEKFVVGGASSVRGYRENLITVDNGVTGSLEWRVPVARIKIRKEAKSADEGRIELCPFIDIGKGWNKDGRALSPEAIYSIGAGVHWTVTENIQAEIYYGRPLKDVKPPGDDDIQDEGVHFRIRSRFGFGF